MFGNASVLCRVVPLLLPPGRLPPRAVNAAMLALALTGWNLWQTARLLRGGDVPVH